MSNKRGIKSPFCKLFLQEKAKVCRDFQNRVLFLQLLLATKEVELKNKKGLPSLAESSPFYFTF